MSEVIDWKAKSDARIRARKPALCFILLYEELRDAARECGYALAVHGSLGRDFDLVAIPWVDEVTSPIALAMKLADSIGGDVTTTERDGKPKPHGRVAFTIAHPRVPAWLDVSVMPRELAPQRESASCEWFNEDNDYGSWRSGCGDLWSFQDGGPVENGMKFCHRCGKPLTVAPQQQDDDYGPNDGEARTVRREVGDEK